MTLVECQNCRSRIMSWTVSCPGCGDDRVGRFQRHRALAWGVALFAAISLGAALPWM